VKRLIDERPSGAEVVEAVLPTFRPLLAMLSAQTRSASSASIPPSLSTTT
jgi:hypothetical protein